MSEQSDAPHHSDPAPKPSDVGAPAIAIPTNAAERKRVPLATGLVDYFPDALVEVARLSLIGNEQHHPGQPLHWDKSKSTDEDDALMRHFIERHHMDTDGVRHRTKVAWRALAGLQRAIDAEKQITKP